MIYIIDAFAWVEYFFGTPKGMRVRTLFKKENKIITMESTLAEMRVHCLRGNENFDMVYSHIKECSSIFPVMRDNWLRAASIKNELRQKRQGFGIIDALLVAKQKEIGGCIVTGDTYFKGLKDVIIL